jgi:hypothetical protein
MRIPPSIFVWAIAPPAAKNINGGKSTFFHTLKTLRKSLIDFLFSFWRTARDPGGPNSPLYHISRIFVKHFSQNILRIIFPKTIDFCLLLEYTNHRKRKG